MQVAFAGVLQPLDLDALKRPARPKAEPRVVVQPPVVPPNNEPPRASAPQPRDRRNWLLIAMAAAIVFLVFLLVGRGVIPIPEPGPVIDAKGLHVLIVRDPSKEISAGQAAVVNSVAVAEWCKANDAKFRRYDAEDDLSKEDRVWRDMRALVTNPPSMVTLRNGRATVGQIPDGIDAAKSQLERLR